jgi:hypothetical protein
MDQKSLGPLEKPIRMIYHVCNTTNSLKYKKRRIRRQRTRRIRRDKQRRIGRDE